MSTATLSVLSLVSDAREKRRVESYAAKLVAEDVRNLSDDGMAAVLSRCGRPASVELFPAIREAVVPMRAAKELRAARVALRAFAVEVLARREGADPVRVRVAVELADQAEDEALLACGGAQRARELVVRAARAVCPSVRVFPGAGVVWPRVSLEDVRVLASLEV
jgi:hypothetical protein